MVAKSNMKCTGSGTKASVSDYCVLMLQAHCPVCQTKVKISIPDKDMHCNTAKFASHQKPDPSNNGSRQVV